MKVSSAPKPAEAYRLTPSYSTLPYSRTCKVLPRPPPGSFMNTKIMDALYQQWEINLSCEMSLFVYHTSYFRIDVRFIPTSQRTDPLSILNVSISVWYSDGCTICESWTGTSWKATIYINVNILSITNALFILNIKY